MGSRLRRYGGFSIMGAMNQNALLEWYKNNHRELPFRCNRDPYRIWVSEIMAQQTRIEAILGAYERFMNAYDSIEKLADADDDELMKLWQGLGYYSRARNLKKAARLCVDCYDGKLPKTKAELKALPGIGDYTAGAIASIAYGERVSAIDGNVIRVYARYYGLEDDFSIARNRKGLEKRVQADLPEEKWMPLWNQALMELGALICTPKAARCADCPLYPDCVSGRSENPLRLPVPKQKAARPQEKFTVYVWYAKDADGSIWIHLRKRPASGLLAGLYQFDEEKPDPVLSEQPLGEHRHLFSHREWCMEGVLVETEKQTDFLRLESACAKCSIPSAFLPFLKRTLKILKKEDIPLHFGMHRSQEVIHGKTE